MAILLSQIRAEASLDASRFIDEARRLRAAQDSLIEGQRQFDNAGGQTDRRLASSGGALERFARQNDAAYRSTFQYQQGLERLNRAAAAGIPVFGGYDRQLQLLTERYNANIAAALKHEAALRTTGTTNASVSSGFKAITDAASGSTRAFGLNRQGFQELQAAGVNAFQALASGATALRVAQTEGAQVLGAFIQGGVLSFRRLAELAVPLGAVAAAVGLVTAAVIRAADTSQNIRTFNAELQVLGQTGQTSGANLQKAFENLKQSGVSASDALTAIQTITRNPLINKAYADDIAQLGVNIAAFTGESLPDTVQKITTALSGGSEALGKYADAFDALTAPQARQLRTTGDLRVGLDALHRRFDGYREENLTPFQRTVESVTKAWDSLLTSFSKSGEIQRIFDGIATSIAEVERIVNGLDTALEKTASFLSRSVAAANQGAQAAQQDLAQGLRERGAEEPEIQNVLRGGAGAGAPTNQALPLIERFESSGRNVPNAQGSGATGYYQITGGTWRRYAPQAGVDISQYPTAISAPRQLQTAVAGRVYQAEGFAPWAPYNDRLRAALAGASTGQLGLDRGQPAAGSLAAQTTAISEQTDAFKKRNQALVESGAVLRATEERNRVFDESLKDVTKSGIAGTLAQNAYDQALREAGIEYDKTTQATRRAIDANVSITKGFAESEGAGLRAAAAAQAYEEVFAQFGSRTTAEQVLARTNQLLEEQASVALRSGQQQVNAFNRTVVANQAVARASEQGTAAVKEAQIVNQAAVQTQDAYAKAVESGNPALVEQTRLLQANAEAQLRANAAAQATTQVNLQAEQTKDQTDLISAQLSLQGQTSSEIQKQVFLLRTKQDLETRFKDASDEAKQNLVDQTTALANANIKLEEARAAQARLDEEWRSIADTISNTVGSALDDLLSGRKITDWGDRFKETLSSIASTIIQTELIKPAIGSALSGLGATNAAQQYGTVDQGGGILSSLLGIGKVAGAANDLASSAAGGSGLFGGVSSSINSFGASAFGLANPALQGPTITGAVLGETGALGGLSLGGLIGPIGAAAAIAVPLISSLVGNKKPSNNAGGVLYDLSTGQVSDAQGGGANLGVAQQITTSLAKFERDLAKLVPNATLPGGQVSVAKGDLTGITTEYTGPLGNIKASFASAQEAVAQFSVAIAQNLGGVSDTVKQVLSTITDPSQIEAALAYAKSYDEVNTAYDNLFQTIGVDSVRKIGPFEQILNKLNDQFDTLTQTAASYGLSLDPINAGYMAATDRLAEDFNKTIAQLTQELVDPAQAAVEAEKKAGEDRVQDAKAVGADLAAVDAYNAANMKKATDAQTKGIEDVAKAAADFQESIGTSFEAIFSSFEQSIGPFEKAANSLADNLQKLTDQAVAAGYSTDAITTSAAEARKRLTQDFNLNIKSLTQAITDPVQAAIDVELAAGQQRIRDAVVVSGNLEDVNRYNTANLERVTQAAKGAVTNLASAQQVAATAASSLNAAISNVLGTGKGQYAQALDALTQQLAALISAAEKVGPLGDLTGIISAFGLSLVDLRNAFDNNIKTLTLGITDPFQQALNIELDAGRRRVSEAQAIGADLALVDEYNRQNLLAVAKAAGTATDAIAAAAGFNQDISQQILAIRDPVAAALQAEIDAGQKRVAAAQQAGADLARVDELNRLKLLQVVDTTEDSTAALDKFTGRLQSLEGALSQLTSGPLSGLTPAQSVTSSTANFDRLLAQVMAGNTDLTPDLAIAGTQAVQSSQNVYGNAKQTADLRARVTKALETVATQTGREASIVAQGVTVTAANQAQVKSALQAQAASARKIADYAEAQADTEFKRTGVENQALRDQASAANAIASQVERQVIAVSAQTGVQNQIVAGLQEQLGTQAAAARAIAAQLQKQADIEYARTGVRQNIYQIESDGARQIAYLLDVQANAQNLTADFLQLAARQANAIADTLQAQADADYQRTGVKNILLQDETDAARQIGINLDKQATSQGQLSQTDASRVQLAVALLQQDAAVAARTAQQQAGPTPVATGNVGTPEQQAAYLAAAQQQASAVAIRVAGEQQAAQQAEAARFAGEQQSQQQDVAAQANLALIQRQQQAISRLQQFIGGDREVGVMLAQLVRFGTVVQDYYSQPYLARDWLHYAYGFVQNWTASEPFSLSDMLAAQGFATGTGSTPPGWIRVGERGPELIKQPGGATILPYGVSPPAAANDDLVAEIRRLQDMFAALVRQMQGGQQVASRDAKVIAEETANVGRKIAFGPPMRRMVG